MSLKTNVLTRGVRFKPTKTQQLVTKASMGLLLPKVWFEPRSQKQACLNLSSFSVFKGC